MLVLHVTAAVFFRTRNRVDSKMFRPQFNHLTI